MRIFKFALPLVAMICFGAVGIPAEAAPSKKSSSASSKSKSGSDSGARKKSSTAKKASKSRKSSKSTKASSRGRSGKSKQKVERVVETTTSNDWIDELPEVELPEVAGPAEDELLEPVPDQQ